jgi:hypothetical protein
MNLWPHKNGTYDPLTYDVRRTMSVRVMLHGPWIELKYPRRNLPLRRMYNDVEPTSVAFLEQKEVIDLTNCYVDLIPENLPNKRIWSKKYPIRIRTKMRKPCKDQPDTTKEIHPDDPSQKPDPVERKKSADDPDSNEDVVPDGEDGAGGKVAEEDFERDEENPLGEIFKDPLTEMADKEEDKRRRRREEMFDDDDEDEREQEMNEDDFKDAEMGDDDPDAEFEVLEEDEGKTFYLFTRTSREKEEWFNRLMVGAKFMQDWNHQNPPAERQVKPDTNYETFKVKEQKFKMYMEDYFQVRSFFPSSISFFANFCNLLCPAGSSRRGRPKGSRDDDQRPREAADCARADGLCKHLRREALARPAQVHNLYRAAKGKTDQETLESQGISLN